MAISKVTLNGTTLMDVTQDTVAANNLLTGETAHGADGEPVIGAYSGGGGETTASQKDVNFIDYDGAILYSYTAAEFANLTALPANPSHSGLTAQGWNWSLTDAKAYVASYGKLWIGQMYITDDGKTRVYIRLEEGRTSPMLGCCPNGTVVVDWGDGSATETLTGTSITTAKWTNTHNYAASGNYVITLNVTSGTVALDGMPRTNTNSYLMRYSSTADGRNFSYQNAIQKVEVGSNTDISTNAFLSCYSLKNITIPNSIITIGNNAFSDCSTLASVTIPNRVTQINNSAFTRCYALESVSLPNSLTKIGGAFFSCSGLASIMIPDSVTSIASNALANCYALASVAIPSGITSIAGSTLNNCYALASVTISSNVTSIESSAFSNCRGLAKLRFEPTTPPTVANSNAWTNIPTDCVISVPTGTLSAYTSATNYPDPATYTYIEED